jgi:hypothetical protein
MVEKSLYLKHFTEMRAVISHYFLIQKEIELDYIRPIERPDGHRLVTVDTALRLSKYFVNTAKFRLGLQTSSISRRKNEANSGNWNQLSSIKATWHN